MSFFLFVLWNFTFTLGRNNGEMFKILYKQRRIYIYVSPCFVETASRSRKGISLDEAADTCVILHGFVQCLLGTRLQAASVFS